jgi:hypothetical protein
MSHLQAGSQATQSGASRRRRAWTLEERRIIAETQAPGASISVVARRYDVTANLLRLPNTPPEAAGHNFAGRPRSFSRSAGWSRRRPRAGAHVVSAPGREA